MFIVKLYMFIIICKIFFCAKQYYIKNTPKDAQFKVALPD